MWEHSFLFLQPLKEKAYISQVAPKGLKKKLHLQGTLKMPLSSLPRNQIAGESPWEA